MSDNLVIAKKEYTEQLLNSISPAIYAGFLSIFEKCKGAESPYKCFQKKLCDIPIWNQNIIETEHNRIIKHSKLEWLDMLIEAIFIVNVKILSSIKPTQKTLNIQLPDSRKFIHECYIHAAREYYVNPKTISLSHSENIDLIKIAINKTIIYLVPQKEVIESVLKQDPEEQTGGKMELDSDDDNNYPNESASDIDSVSGEDLLMDRDNISGPEQPEKEQDQLTQEPEQNQLTKEIEENVKNVNLTPLSPQEKTEPPQLETIPDTEEKPSPQEDEFFFSDED